MSKQFGLIEYYNAIKNLLQWNALTIIANGSGRISLTILISETFNTTILLRQRVTVVTHFSASLIDAQL